MNIIDYAISHSRVVLGILVFVLVAGGTAYINIPKEASPDVNIPFIYISLSQKGISRSLLSQNGSLFAVIARSAIRIPLAHQNPASVRPSVRVRVRTFFGPFLGPPTGFIKA